MDRRNVIPITLIVASIILAVVSYVILPQNVMIQFSVGSSGNTYVPKIVAILLALLLGVGGAIAEIIMKEDVRAKRKCLVVSIVGVFVFIFTLVVNMMMVNQTNFTGNRVKNPDSYLLECEMMNGEDRHSIHMEKDDVLNVDCDVKQGGMQVTVGKADSQTIYKSDSIESGSFTLTASEEGNYVISVKAKRFQGTLKFELE